MRFSSLFCIALFFLATNVAKGQQAVQYTMTSLNKYGFNPAYAGLKNSLDITAVYRQQWSGLSGAPRLQNININSPIYRLKGGFGINIDNELKGAERTTSAVMTYNYWIPIGDESVLSLGVSGGISQKALDATKIRTPEGSYNLTQNTLDHNDGLLPQANTTGTAPTFDVGMYFKHPVFELGISVKNVSEQNILLDDELISFNYSLKRNYFFNFATEWNIFDRIVLNPTIFLKSDLIENQTDFSILLRYDDNMLIGTSLRGYSLQSLDALGFILGFNLSEKISFAYSYDINLSDLNKVNKGSHELMLNYNLNKPIGGGIPPTIIYNPRFL